MIAVVIVSKSWGIGKNNDLLLIIRKTSAGSGRLPWAAL
jgi:hypothetical protein